MLNFIFRWQCDVALSTLTSKADFRNPCANTEVHIVLSVVAVAVHWVNMHPEGWVAVWLMSTVTTDEDYIKAGASDLLARPKAAMHDPVHREINAEYRRFGGIWDTRTCCCRNSWMLVWSIPVNR